MNATLVAAVAALAAMVSVADAQPARLGTISFPTSGSPEAQERFVRGVLYLHSFEYGSAAREFRAAQRLDPGFVMGHWGEAMASNHPIWNEQDAGAGRAVLRRLGATREARLARAPTPRERAYLEAVEALYGDGPKARRDTAYAEAMRRVVEAYPDDVEAKAFYALALLGLSQGTREVSTYLRAAAVAEEVFRRNPNHPGAAHYIIHAYDDPMHAPRGLEAARAYSGIAPDAAHAQHMTTHIFVAMGMWDEVVSQNEIAANLTGWAPGHYTDWLGYGLLQQGRHRDAQAHLQRVRRNMGAPGTVRQRWHLADMRAHYLFNTEEWSSPTLGWNVDVSGLEPRMRVLDAFVRGYAAVKRGNLAAARRALGAASTAARRSGDRVADTIEQELQASILFAEGGREEAVAMLRGAAAIEDSIPFEFGPPRTAKPPRELLGEMLLEMGRFDEARREFEGALRRAPRRALSLYGLARAAEGAGDREAAARAYAELLQVWRRADRGLPALAEVERRAPSPRR
jgi:tetratricopeptide (TPR) repeat protein